MIAISDIKLKLLLGLPIEIPFVGKMYIPNLNDIATIGEGYYGMLSNAILFDKSNLKNTEFDDFSNFEVLFAFVNQDLEFRNAIFDSFNLFFKEELSLCEDGFFYLGERSDERIINQDSLSIIQNVVKLANMVKEKEEEHKPANERTKKFIKKMEKNKAKRPKQKERIDLQSMISGLAWRDNGISLMDIGKLNIFQLYDAFQRVENIDNYEFTLSGIYAGTVDSKKINMSDINWAKIIN